MLDFHAKIEILLEQSTVSRHSIRKAENTIRAQKMVFIATTSALKTNSFHYLAIDNRLFLLPLVKKKPYI